MSELDPAERFRKIQEREADIKRREAELRKQNVATKSVKPPNFPPCYPFMHHDIANDIPMLAQWTVRLHLIGMIGTYVTLFWNFLTACGVGQFPNAAYSVAQNVIFSIVIFPLGVGCSWKINYMKFYSQVEKGRIKFTMFALQILFICAVCAACVGIPNSGCMGFIMALDGLGSNSGFAKLTCIVSIILWVIVCVWQIFMLTKMFLLYKVLDSSHGPVEATRIEDTPAEAQA